MLRFRSKHRRRWVARGMVAVQAAICLVPLCGVAAFAIDGGMMFEYRRRVQATTDAAALAAASDLYLYYLSNLGLDLGGTAKASAISTATANGFSTNSTLTVNIPPQSGPFIGKFGYVEVVLVYQMPRGFSAILGSGTLPIQARSVARGLRITNSTGVVLLDPTGSGALSMSGNTSVVVTGSVNVNSTSSTGATASGNASITAPHLDFGGSPGYSTSGNAKFYGSISSNAGTTADPLASLAVPSTTSMTVQGNSLNLSGLQIATLNPGVYNGGITLSGNAIVVLTPGIYYLNGGGLSVSGNASLTGAGVMFYNGGSTVGSIALSGNGAINITPPLTGTYQGMALFQNRSSSTPVSLSGNALSTITGSIYAPAATVTLSGNSAVNMIGSQYIAYDMKLSGNGAALIDPVNGISPLTRIFGLVE